VGVADIKQLDSHGYISRNMMESGKIEDGGMAEWLNAPVLKTFFAIPASARK
jgi:hypothetical protein